MMVLATVVFAPNELVRIDPRIVEVKIKHKATAKMIKEIAAVIMI